MGNWRIDPDELSGVPGELSDADDSSNEDQCSDEGADGESSSLSQVIMKEDLDFNSHFKSSTLEPGPSKEDRVERRRGEGESSC